MGDARPEYVFLGYLAEGACHGYVLYQRFAKDLEGLWHISESQMYASLKRLEKRGWIAPLQEETQNRQPYGLTGKGQAAYEGWLWTPTGASPRLLKLEFLTRLYFAMRRDMDEAYGLVESQRGALEAELDRLLQDLSTNNKDLASDTAPLRSGTPPVLEHRDVSALHQNRVHQAPLLFNISVLARDFRIRQIRAALDWMKELL